MLDEFLPYLDSWETSVKERPGFTEVEKLLSQPTLDGLRMTGRIFTIQWTCTASNELSFTHSESICGIGEISIHHYWGQSLPE